MPLAQEVSIISPDLSSPLGSVLGRSWTLVLAFSLDPGDLAECRPEAFLSLGVVLLLDVDRVSIHDLGLAVLGIKCTLSIKCMAPRSHAPG